MSPGADRADGGVRCVVFDLDDTLYLERDYVRSGFTAVAEIATAHLPSAGATAPEDLARFLWERFERGERGAHFDALLAEHPALAPGLAVPALVEAYRAHRPTIALRPEAGAVLDALDERGILTALISDGALVGQAAKVEALGLRERLTGPVVLTDDWGREFWKPHPRAFEHVERETGLAGADLVYVADNPAKDFVSPRARGWRCVRLRTPGQLHAAVADDVEPDATITTLADLLDRLG